MNGCRRLRRSQQRSLRERVEDGIVEALAADYCERHPRIAWQHAERIVRARLAAALHAAERARSE